MQKSEQMYSTLIQLWCHQHGVELEQVTFKERKKKQ